MKSRLKPNALSVVLALILTASAALAGPGQDKPVNKDYNVIAIPVDENVNQEPVQQIQVPANATRGGEGTVSKIPLDGLKAEKFRTNGKTGWKITIPGGRALATPAVVNGMVYVGGGFGSYEFYAFDAKTGEPKWAIKVSDDGPTAAVIDDGVVAFNTESCTLFVVDARTGRLLWGKWLGDPLMSQPAIGDGKVFMAYPTGRGHQLIALGLKDGKEKWTAPITSDIISAPVIYKDSVYLAAFDGNVYRFRMKDGKLVWKKDFRATSAPWLYKDQVFVSKREDSGEARPSEGVGRMENKGGGQNQSKGTWRTREAPYLDAEVQSKSNYRAAQKSDDASVGFSSAPAAANVGAAEKNVGQNTVRGLWEYQGSRPCISDGRLFLTQGDQVVALDPDSGREIWVRDLSGDLEKIGGHLGAPPSPAGGKLYLATVNGKIMVLSQKDGKLLQTIDLGGPMRFQPALAKGWLYAGTTDGTLIGLDLDDSTADGWTMWGGGPSHNGQ